MKTNLYVNPDLQIEIISAFDLSVYEPIPNKNYLLFSLNDCSINSNQPDIVISPHLQNQLIDYILLCAKDIRNLDFIDEEDYKYFHVYTEEQAKQILDILVKNISNTDIIICQCVVGISRSSGLAVALSQILNMDYSWITNGFTYRPNKHILNTTINTWNKYYKKKYKFINKENNNENN